MKPDFKGVLTKSVDWTRTMRSSRVALGTTMVLATSVALTQLNDLQSKFTQAGAPNPLISALLAQERDVSSAATDSTQKAEVQAVQSFRPNRLRVHADQYNA